MTHDSGKHLYEITGRLSKPAGSPPFLTSRVHAQRWISQSDVVAQRPWMVISVEEDAMIRVRPPLLTSEEALYKSLCRLTPEALRDALGQSWSRVSTMTEGRSIGIISASQTDRI